MRDDPTIGPITIEGASVIDGTGAAASEHIVHIVDGRIVVGGPVPPASTIMNGQGLVLCPGFIDCHTHDDAAAITQPLMAFKTTQGVTSVVVGNCGTSIAPIAGMVPGVKEFPRLADYFDVLDRSPAAVNVASLIGHGSVRTSVVGLTENRIATSSEMDQMLKIVGDAMADGAIGLSTGLEYEPGRYVSADELVELMGPVAALGGLYATHMRNSADLVLESIGESIAIGERSGAAVQISHLKATGQKNFGKVSVALQMMRDARQRGLDVMTDVYPFTRGSTLLEQILGRGDLDGGENARFGGDAILIATAPQHPEWEGRTLTDIGTPLGLDALAAARMIVDACGRSCIAIMASMDEGDVQTVLSDPLCMIGSDGIPTKGKPHPRLHHTFTRTLGHYSRELGIVDLPDIIHRMTGMTASRFGFKNRGLIADGYHADLVLFDPKTIIDTGNYEHPQNPPMGIHSVFVNGVLTVSDNQPTGARAGMSVRWNR